MNKHGKLLTYLAAFFIIIVLNFLLPRLIPGDPFMAIYGEEAALTLSEETKQELISKMSLDQPLWTQFQAYFGTLLHGDLGYSYSLNASVWSVILGVLPWTLLLAGSALIISTALGIILGIESGWRKGSRYDRIIRIGVIGMSGLPNFLIGIILLLIFSIQLGLFPLGGAITPYSGYTGIVLWTDILEHLMLPVTALVIAQVTETTLLTRASMLGNLRSPYVMTAAAKGLGAAGVRYRHAGRNALLPVTARLGVAVGRVLAGTLFIEIVFSYPGMGSLIHQAILSRDYPLLQGIFLLIALIIIAANFAADSLALRIDPRTREE